MRNRTSGSMSGERKRSVAAWPKLPRLSSTLPKDAMWVRRVEDNYHPESPPRFRMGGKDGCPVSKRISTPPVLPNGATEMRGIKNYAVLGVLGTATGGAGQEAPRESGCYR
jgi:hypothetical protein